MTEVEARAGTIDVAIFSGRGGGTVAGQSIRNQAARGGPLRLHGFLDDVIAAGTAVLDAAVLGPFESWKGLPETLRFLAPLHKAGHMVERAARIRGLGVPSARWVSVIDPDADVPDSVSVGAGTLVSPFASCQPGVRLGDHVAVRSGAGIGHDTHVGDFAFFGINSATCGYVTVEEGAHISPGACIREHVRVGAWSVVGLGAVVLSDVPEGTVVAGNPARPIGTVSKP